MFGVGQVVGAVGEVCGGSRHGVELGRRGTNQFTRLESSRNSSTYRSSLRPLCRKPHSTSSAAVILWVLDRDMGTTRS